MPTVWWPGSRDVLRSEGKLRHAATTLSKAIDKLSFCTWLQCVASRVFCYTLLTYSTVVNWNPGRGLVNLKRILHSRFFELSYPQSWVFLCNAGGRVTVGALPPSPSICSVIIWWIATASAGCGFFYAGFFSTWCARIVGQTGVWHRQAISDNSVLVSVYCVLLRILSEGLGTGN
jgi:hypothetical protein